MGKRKRRAEQAWNVPFSFPFPSSCIGSCLLVCTQMVSRGRRSPRRVLFFELPIPAHHATTAEARLVRGWHRLSAAHAHHARANSAAECRGGTPRCGNPSLDSFAENFRRTSGKLPVSLVAPVGPHARDDPSHSVEVLEARRPILTSWDCVHIASHWSSPTERCSEKHLATYCH
jgi:hypothetical protein